MEPPPRVVRDRRAPRLEPRGRRQGAREGRERVGRRRAPTPRAANARRGPKPAKKKRARGRVCSGTERSRSRAPRRGPRTENPVTSSHPRSRRSRGARRAFAPCGGYPLAAAGRRANFSPRRRSMANPCSASRSPRGARRASSTARARKRRRPRSRATPRGWLRALTNGALRVAAWDREEDGELFEPPRVPRARGERTPAEARAAAAKEWRAMATAPLDGGGGGRGGRVGAGAAEAGTVRALGGVGAVFA